MDNHSLVSVPEWVVSSTLSDPDIDTGNAPANRSAPTPNPKAKYSSEIHESFLDVFHDPALIIEPYSKTILAANARAIETYSGKDRQLVGTSASNLLADVVRDSRMLAEVLAQGYVCDFDTIRLDRNGTEIAVSTNATMVTFRGKSAVLAVDLDITEREKTQRGIMLANVEWRDTVDSVQDMIILEDQFGMIRRCNASTTRFLGKPYNEIIGKNLLEFFEGTPDSPPDHLRRRFWEGRFIGRDGWFEVKSHRVKADNGTGNVWVHVIKDITAQRKDKQELLKLYSVIEQASDGTIIVDLLGTVQYANEIAERAISGSRRTLVGESICSIRSEIKPETLRDEIFPHLESESSWRTTNSIKRDRETIVEEITVSRVIDIEGRPMNYVFVFRDVTETRRLESIAEAVNLMENVGYVFSGIRHELGNPINSVKMALTVLEKNYQKWDHEQVHVFISRCLQELGRVEYLLKTLKNFSLHESAELGPVDIDEFMRHFSSFTRADFERRGIEVTCEDSVEQKAFCDPRALHQVMMNLMANAADALADRDEPRIAIRVTETRNRLSISVEDNGIGMTEKQQSNLFKPFYTSKPGGTGLGLVIVQKMLATMGGTIEIESESEVGTQAHIGLKTA